jgi:NIPSNAP
MKDSICVAFSGLLLLGSPSMANPSDSQSSPVIELRQYALRAGQRDVLIALFEREFIESQEALGMRILGTFRDLDRSDRFVWIRGFRDMSSRADGLDAFYSGPVWKAHRSEANATMLDSDNVLLLHVARTDSGLDPGDRPRPPKGATVIPKGLLVANIYSFAAPVGGEFLDFFDRAIRPELGAAGVTVQASYVSESSPNNFPRLPVRENENVFVWFSSFDGPSDYEASLARLARSPKWRSITEVLQAKLKGQPEVLRLEPTPRSGLPNRANLRNRG